MNFKEAIDYMNATIDALPPIERAKILDAASQIRRIVDDYDGNGALAVILIANEVCSSTEKP